MKKTLVSGALALMFMAVGMTTAAEPALKGEVSLAIDGGKEQPAGGPLVVDLTVINMGKEPISWWCGGPDLYPGAEHFLVEVRYRPDAAWQPVNASNGQYVEGSGGDRSLTPGQAIVVPLAIPIELPGGKDVLAREGGSTSVNVRVTARSWHAAAAAESYVTVRNDRETVDHRHARTIQAVVEGKPSFWTHLAEQYPDPIMLDAMLKLVTVDCMPLAKGAAKVLARQPALPEKAGEDLGRMVQRCLVLAPRTEWGGLQEDMVAAALKTQAETARQTVLDLMQKTSDGSIRWILINALRLSPGDAKWLTRARAAMVAVGQASPNDQELSRQITVATQWIDSRLQNRDDK